MLKLEKINILRIFCSTAAFEGVKEIFENTVRKSKRVEHSRNKDQEGRMYSESIRVK